VITQTINTPFVYLLKKIKNQNDVSHHWFQMPPLLIVVHYGFILLCIAIAMEFEFHM